MVDSASGQEGKTSSSIAATAPRNHAGKRGKTRTSNFVVTLILAAPTRFYFAEHTYRHPKERGFPNIFWVANTEGGET